MPHAEPATEALQADRLLAALFPSGHAVAAGAHGTLHGTASCDGRQVEIIGITGGQALGIDGAILLAGDVLRVVQAGGDTPIILLVDTSSQVMARRDEMLGLNEYLAHLCKSLALAAAQGHPTIGVLHGPAAAGAFIATALSTQVLAALPGADPSVMDLPSIARVTRLPLDRLQAMARSTPIFAPGLAPLVATGAVTESWTEADAAGRLQALLASAMPAADSRDRLGEARGGRTLAAGIAERVAAEAARDG